MASCKSFFVTANKTICNVAVSLLSGCPDSGLHPRSCQKPLINTQLEQGLSSACSARHSIVLSDIQVNSQYRHLEKGIPTNIENLYCTCSIFHVKK